MTDELGTSPAASVPSRVGPGDVFALGGRTIEGQFVVESFVGSGEATCVYRARHLALGAPVVVQCATLPGEDADRAQLAFAEAARLHYRFERRTPHVAKVMGSGQLSLPLAGHEARLVPFLVREWFEGGTLARYLEQRRSRGLGGRSLVEVIAALAPVARALGLAHGQGIAHLAVSPWSVFLPGAEPEDAKLADFGFGLARRRQDLLRQPFAAYAAPEQLEARERRDDVLTPAADVYSLALLVLELLRDLPVHAAGASWENVQSAAGQASRRAADPALPREAREVLGRALSLDPLKRHPESSSFWEDLVRTSTAAPSLPQVPSRPSRPSPRPFPLVDGWEPDAITAPKVVPPRVPSGPPRAPATPPPVAAAVPVVAFSRAPAASPFEGLPFIDEAEETVEGSAEPGHFSQVLPEPEPELLPSSSAAQLAPFRPRPSSRPPPMPEHLVEIAGGTPSFDALAAAQNKPEGEAVEIEMTSAPLRGSAPSVPLVPPLPLLPMAQWPPRVQVRPPHQTTVRIVRRAGVRDVLVGLASFAVVSVLGFAAVFFFGNPLQSRPTSPPPSSAAASSSNSAGLGSSVPGSRP